MQGIQGIGERREEETEGEQQDPAEDDWATEETATDLGMAPRIGHARADLGMAPGVHFRGSFSHSLISRTLQVLMTSLKPNFEGGP